VAAAPPCPKLVAHLQIVDGGLIVGYSVERAWVTAKALATIESPVVSGWR
jgi:hypothetical protein